MPIEGSFKALSLVLVGIMSTLPLGITTPIFQKTLNEGMFLKSKRDSAYDSRNIS